MTILGIVLFWFVLTSVFTCAVDVGDYGVDLLDELRLMALSILFSPIIVIFARKKQKTLDKSTEV